MSLHRTTRSKLQGEAESFTKRAGYAMGGAPMMPTGPMAPAAVPGAAAMPAMKRGGRKRKHGGEVKGEKPKARLDKRRRGGSTIYAGVREDSKHMTQPITNVDKISAPKRAEGGAVKHKGSGKVNIIINAGGEDAEKMQKAKMEGAQMGAMAVVQKLKGAGGGPPGAPPMPPGGGPAAGGPPGVGAPPSPGAPPMAPMMRATGGKVATDQLAARQAGPGRLKLMEKNLERKGEPQSGMVKVKGHERRARGGKAC